MHSRRLLRVCCALALLVALVDCDSSAGHRDDQSKVESEAGGEPIHAEIPRSPVKLAIKVLEKAFVMAAKKCLIEAANNCKDHWNSPKNLVKCGKEFFNTNKGRCIVS